MTLGRGMKRAGGRIQDEQRSTRAGKIGRNAHTSLASLVSDDELISRLEQLSGRSFRNAEDVRAYVLELAQRRAEGASSTIKTWKMTKQAMWLLLLTCAYLQYHIMDVMVEVSSLQAITFIAQPIKSPPALISG